MKALAIAGWGAFAALLAFAVGYLCGWDERDEWKFDR